MQRRTFLAAAVGATAALAGCSSGTGRSLPTAPTGDWTHSARDARNTGAADVPVPPRGAPAWDRGDAHVATPLVADGTVFSVAHEATALDAQSGEQQWAVDLPDSPDHAPALTADRLFVAADDRLLALAREDGTERWGVDLSQPADAPLTVDPDSGTVVVPLAGRQGVAGVVAYGVADGDRRWTDATVSPRTAAIADGTVYLTGYEQDGDTGTLRALSVADGAERWTTELDNPDAPPVLADAGLLVADGGTLALHDPGTGDRIRSLGTFGDRIPEAPAVADGTAFVASSDGELVAVETADGTERWRRDVGVVAGTGISVGREAVVASVRTLPAGSLSGIAAYERADGTPRWGHQIEGFDAAPSTAPVLAEDAAFYVSNESRGVVALGDLPATEEE